MFLGSWTTHLSCRAVPFEEDDHDPSIWFLDHSYMENMYRMFKKVNGECAQRMALGGFWEHRKCHGSRLPWAMRWSASHST